MYCGLPYSLASQLIIQAHTLPVNGTALGIQEQSLHMMSECENKSNSGLNLLAYAENGTFT